MVTIFLFMIDLPPEHSLFEFLLLLLFSLNLFTEKAENTTELDVLINKPVTTRFEKTPARNEPCVCGSGKKYKKCCG